MTRPSTLSNLCRAGMALLLSGSLAYAQSDARRIALKSGESVELGPVYWVVKCRSIVVGVPAVEVLEGPAELELSIKEGMVLPRRQNCAKTVDGGTLVATAKDVKEPVQARLTYRVKYKTKDGDRQGGGVINVSLFP